MSPSTSPARRYAFLRTRRWAGLIAAMVVVSVTCALLGVWQWGRYESRYAEARQVEAVHDAEPVPLTEALDSLAGPVGTDEAWRTVELTGRYVDGGTVLLRNRPVDGTPAVHVVAPFVATTDAGEVLVIVDRGWVEASRADTAGAELPQPPAGEVTLTARLRVAEEPYDRVPPAGQIYTLAPEQVMAGVATVTDAVPAGLPVLDGYVAAVAEDPAATTALPGYGRPTFRYATNMSYAFQWWFFSAGALAALVILARREAAEDAGDRAGSEDAVPARKPRLSAEAEEDAIVEAQLRRG
ncbi:SURF1 family cytochrome oxidase biogenesis protein [Georgenia subflava]|uniref:SURF1-like protein n=1 Tax=Georgenia subflava TaxID=1622177 RepID=A0A6N7EBL0_9MICO|nr:SURF1 family protein [Georgenia subflava]MPV35792.1 SURF1 family protein [Georgenia subflava]